jgi:RNA polymerase sigma factor (sigma-70 family)
VTIISTHTLTTSDLEQVYREMYPARRSYLQRKVQGPDQAEDLAQETFYRALKALQTGTCRLPTTIHQCRSWLYRIATNLAIDTLRRAKCFTWCALDQAYTVPTNEPGADPENVSLQREAAQAVHATLASLPEHDRRVLVLYYQGGLPLAQVAHLLGITSGSCKMLVKRARGAFVQQYGKQGELSA